MVLCFIGIDIAKNTHEASIIDSFGKLVSESISFPNSVKGFENSKLYFLF
ncbi:IS110 family transposase [Clostridium septicum]|nr:transposase [Clostridium septicum]